MVSDQLCAYEFKSPLFETVGAIAYMEPNHKSRISPQQHRCPNKRAQYYHGMLLVPQNLAYVSVYTTSSQNHTQHHRHGRKGQSYTTQSSSQLMHCINDTSCCVGPASEPKLADITQKVSTQQQNWVWQLHTVTHITAYVAHTHCSQEAHCH